MKKILSVLFALALGASSVFAIESSVDLNFAVPVILSSDEVDATATVAGKTTGAITESLTAMSGFGLNLNGTAMLTKMFGVRAGFGLAWPTTRQTQTKTTTYVLGNASVSDSTTTTNIADYCDSFVNTSLFVGGAIRPVLTKRFQVLVTPGVSFSWISSKTKGSDSTSTAFYFGAGVEVTGEVNIYKGLYATISLPFTYQFTESVDGTATDGYKGSCRFNPQIGAGYRF